MSESVAGVLSGLIVAALAAVAFWLLRKAFPRISWRASTGVMIVAVFCLIGLAAWAGLLD